MGNHSTKVRPKSDFHPSNDPGVSPNDATDGKNSLEIVSRDSRKRPLLTNHKLALILAVCLQHEVPLDVRSLIFNFIPQPKIGWFEHIQVMCRGNYTLIYAYDRCYYCGLSPVAFTHSRISGKTPAAVFGFKEFFPQSGEAEIMRSVLYVSAGLKHMMVTTDDGRLYCYGASAYGQSGYTASVVGKVKAETGHHFIRVEFPTDQEVVSFSTGDYHNMIHTWSGLWGFGMNASGQLGKVTQDNFAKPQKIEFTHGSVKTVECGGYHTIVHSSEGIFGCGLNFSGQLGLGDTQFRLTFVKIEFFDTLLDSLVFCSCGTNTTFVCTTNGVFAAGQNSNGELGLGDELNRTSFSRVDIDFEPVTIKSGDKHTLMLSKTGDLYVCGSNECGQLGLGDYNDRSKFEKVLLENNSPIESISCGLFHSMFTTRSNKLYGCGSNRHGQLGLPSKSKDTIVTTFVSISVQPSDKAYYSDVARIYNNH